ncbi:Vacuolar protein sorting-associated protein 24-like 1 [Vitis vinifera]|uniref:Vacuolar protein sorting-associated protein 24-like 1 n=1 Tax=Vitis vinifera TaxID=29760 RepID=A0A438C2V4_VITVI|nr:Vacuolar protein sorting-associated protein 24-like 1 [Vitis vinifera]
MTTIPLGKKSNKEKRRIKHKKELSSVPKIQPRLQYQVLAHRSNCSYSGALSKSAEVMKLVNNLMKAPEVAVTMQEFSKEMTKTARMWNIEEKSHQPISCNLKLYYSIKFLSDLLSSEETGFQAGVIEEIVNDAVDTALDSEDIEEEIEEEVDKVLTAIAGETAAQLPEAVRKERVKQPAQTAEADDEEAIAEGADDEEELEEIRARLAKVRS